MPSPASPFLKSDILVIVAGLVGSGRSTFINALLPSDANRVPVGHSLGACTAAVDYRIVDLSKLPQFKRDYRLVLVDTPGFDSDNRPYHLVMRDITEWLQKHFPGERRHAAGVVFLHDLSTDRYLGVTDIALRAFKSEMRLPVSISATKAGRLNEQEKERRRDLFMKQLSRVITDAKVHEYEEGADAWAILAPLLSEINPEARIRSTDIVLLVTGLAGSGRSTFINALLPESVPKREVGYSLTSCTKQVNCAIVDLRESTTYKRDFRLVLVDTPGFDDHARVDSSALVLQDIIKWLHDYIPERNCRGGVIYMHDMTKDRFQGSAAELDLSALDRSLNSDLCPRLVIVTTKWSLLPNGEGEVRYETLEKRWSRMLSAGTKVHHFKKEEDAWAIASSFLSRIEAASQLDFEKGLAPLSKAEKKSSAATSTLARLFSDILMGMFGGRTS
ncbi:hypothetical protein NMY22_g3154 [Coprinellus aureogranulatus]|nr:hypothetical protein NMY22_g3154 [Coprinellus aureogranulatus]